MGNLLIGNNLGGEHDKEILIIKDQLGQLSQAVGILNNNILTLNFVLEFVLQKIEIDGEELKAYVTSKFKELEKEARNNIIV